MKNILWILLGMVVMYFLLTMLSKKKNSGVKSDTTELFLNLAKTQQAKELIKSSQFKNVLKTDEFKKLFSSLSGEYLQAFTESLVK